MGIAVITCAFDAFNTMLLPAAESTFFRFVIKKKLCRVTQIIIVYVGSYDKQLPSLILRFESDLHR